MTGTRPLRLLYVVPDLGVGGAERHVTTLLPRMDPERFSVSALCLGEPGALFGDLVDAGVPARALRRPRRQAVLALAELVVHLRRTRPDVVIVRGYNAEVLGRVAAVLARVPRTVVWVHNHGDITPRGRLRRFADRVLDRVTDAYYGVAHAQTAYLVDDLGHPPEKVRIVHNGVDPDLFDPDSERDPLLAAELGIVPGSPVVTVLAALRPEKDHALLLRAVRRVVDRLPDARLLVVGDGVERSSLEKLTADLGLTATVVFTGSRDDVPAVLALSDVVTLASYSIECFPMSVLEAMAAGRPAVCTAVGGVPEMVEDGVTGYLVPPHDETALAERLTELLTDREAASRMGAAARAVVEQRFSLDVSVRAAETALAETVAPRGAPRPAPRPVRLTVVLDLTFVGGAEAVLLETLRRLDPAVATARLVCLREAGPLAAEFRDAGIEVEVLGRTGRFDPRTVPRLARSLRADRTDVVLVAHHHRAALAIGRLTAQLVGARSIVAAHDMDLTTVGRRCLPRSTVETLAFSDALVLLAPSQGEYLHREEGVGRFPWRRTREVVIANGIPLGPPRDPATRAEVRAELGYTEDDVVVVVVARLSDQKAHHVLFEAVSRPAAQHPGLHLLVVGGGPREAELRTLADTLGIAGRTRFTGIRRDVPRLLQGCDVSCLSSVHEGVPLTVLESMAAGLPVAATDCGAMRDVVSDGATGHLVPVGDVAALAARLGELAADPARRAALGSAGRTRAVADFDIVGTAAGLQDLLVDLTRKDVR